jgi:hypothetical protein
MKSVETLLEHRTEDPEWILEGCILEGCCIDFELESIAATVRVLRVANVGMGWLSIGFFPKRSKECLDFLAAQ